MPQTRPRNTFFQNPGSRRRQSGAHATPWPLSTSARGFVKPVSRNCRHSIPDADLQFAPAVTIFVNKIVRMDLPRTTRVAAAAHQPQKPNIFAFSGLLVSNTTDK
ncbi:hypothetical protein BDY21DRAFT_357775 [Lineolata rhizophorae]|uniref:Uncharacterized protein n=1 Tax=Lineolata rhizophorae TaxID=578093 RepID=A0A6A6NMB6_9PEZI|nr:hypothetical protein BDY21DRAFT_357775 [Lineolata rhizophorae]